MQIRTMQMEDYDAVFALWKSCSGMGLNDVDDSRSGIERFCSKIRKPVWLPWKKRLLLGRFWWEVTADEPTSIIPQLHRNGKSKALVRSWYRQQKKLCRKSALQRWHWWYFPVIKAAMHSGKSRGFLHGRI